jgi:hypothetical protein
VTNTVKVRKNKLKKTLDFSCANGKNVILLPAKRNVERFELLATTEKNAKNGSRPAPLFVLARFLPIS